MSVKEHYDHHLENFYSWMVGDFEEKKDDFLTFCNKSSIVPVSSGIAIDLGAGNGIQSVALAETGFNVLAIDFSKQLLLELEERVTDKAIKIFNDDIKNVLDYTSFKPELIICCGDTISHLESAEAIKQLLKDSYEILISEGKIILSFRDYAEELKDVSRFIPVKSDSGRILTCFIEYFPDTVRVTDIFHLKENEVWIQKISSYSKVRISQNLITEFLKEIGFNIVFKGSVNRMVHLIGQKD